MLGNSIQYEIYLSKLMKKLYDTPIRAIRKNCLDCSNNQFKDVKLCTVISCPLYPYRMGTRPSNETKDTLKQLYEEKPEIA